MTLVPRSLHRRPSQHRPATESFVLPPDVRGLHHDHVSQATMSKVQSKNNPGPDHSRPVGLRHPNIRVPLLRSRSSARGRAGRSDEIRQDRGLVPGRVARANCIDISGPGGLKCILESFSKFPRMRKPSVKLPDGSRDKPKDIRSEENEAGAAIRDKLRGRKRRVSNRNLCSRRAAQCHHSSIKLLCQRFNHAGTKSGFRLSEHAVRFTGAIVGDRKLPICS